MAGFVKDKMKKWILAIFITTLLSVAVFSQVALQEGEVSPVTCFIAAYSEGGLFLNEDDAIFLCGGTQVADAPIDCFLYNFPEDLLMTDEDRLILCSGTDSEIEPVNCFLEFYNNDFLDLSFDEALDLCQGSSSSQTTRDCFDEAYAEDGLYLILDSAITLCSGI